MEGKEKFKEIMEDIANVSQLWNVTLMCSDGTLRNVVEYRNTFFSFLFFSFFS